MFLILSLIPLSPQLHFIYLARSTKWLLAGLGTVFTVFLVLVLCGMFFPYTADPSGPRPKRVFLQVRPSDTHPTRLAHTSNGSSPETISGTFCLDAHTPDNIE